MRLAEAPVATSDSPGSEPVKSHADVIGKSVGEAMELLKRLPVQQHPVFPPAGLTPAGPQPVRTPASQIRTDHTHEKDNMPGDAFEKGYANAQDYLGHIVTPHLPLIHQATESHRLLFEQVFVEEVAGMLKKDANCVMTPGGRITFTLPQDVEEMYRWLIERATMHWQGLNPPPGNMVKPNDEKAWPAPNDNAAWIARLRFVAWFHAQLIFIHPFEDGNGRLTRFLAWEQMRRLFPEVSMLPPDQLLRAVDEKSGPFGDHQSKGDYKQAMQVLRVGTEANLTYLMKYFNPRPDTLDIPWPQTAEIRVKVP